MKIAIFHNVSPGGAKRVIFEEIKYLKKRSHHVDLYKYSQTDDNFLPLGKLVDNIYCYDFEVKHNQKGIFRLYNDLKVLFGLNLLSKKIAKQIDRQNYDVVLVHPDNYTQAPYILRHLSTPSVYYCEELLRNVYEKELQIDQNIPIHKYIYEKLIRLVRKYTDKINAKMANTIITNSSFIKNKVNIVYNRSSYVVYPGVDNKVFCDRIDKKENYILYVGDKDKVAGYQFAMKISDGIGEKYRLNVISRNNGKLNYSDKEMADIYSKALFSLSTSYEEPFGLAVLESMSCGTPVLAVNEGGYRETIKNGENGYLLERNINSFVDHANLLINNYKLYKKMSAYCKMCASKLWSWDQHGNKLIKYLKMTVKNRKYIYE